MRSRACSLGCVGVLLILLSWGACGGRPSPSREADEQRSFAAPGWISGYHAALSGGTITYHSPQPDVNSALLVRSLDSRDFIAWETAPVPHDFTGDFASFIWMFGMDVDSSPHEYGLHVNGRNWFRFANPRESRKRQWSLSGPHGSRLDFRITMIDRHGDIFGYAALRVPGSELRRGQPVHLKVVGESAGSRVWYMTFQSPIQAQTTVFPQPALVRRGGALFQPVHIHIVHLGRPIAIRLTTEGAEPLGSQVSFGFNRLIMYLPRTETEVRQHMRIELGERQPVFQEFLRGPVRRWTVYLVQHTHTDIGYTRPQTEILAEHLRFIDYALDYCDLTETYPDEARFRWTCEASWAVDEYLKTRPARQVSRLRERIQQGRIEITSMPFNMSEIADENILARSLLPLQRFRTLGLPVTTAMQNDVNGIAWCLADFFPPTGIRYLTMGQHGHRARIPFDIPTAFWWESPSGRRMLAFRADHYNTGNFWGIHTGHFENTEKGLLRYLQELELKGYPFDRIAVQYAGYFTDNSPPSLVGPEFIRAWNERYAWPRLKSATAREFLRHLDEEHGRELETLRVAWPDWWSDGFGSSARETAAARSTQADLIANQGLLSMARLMGSQLSLGLSERLDKIASALLFWDEHTMGAAESISDPLSENSMVQWAEKAAYVWEAAKENRLLRETAMGLIQDYIPKDDTATMAVFNTLGRPRSGLVEVYIDHEILPTGRDFRLVDAGSGESLAAQPSHSRADGTTWYVWVPDVPSWGYRLFRIESQATARPELRRLQGQDHVLENSDYRIAVDPKTGGITSLVDKQWGLDLVDPESEWKMGELIHERISNRAQLERFRLVDQERSGLRDVRVEPGVNGPIWKSLLVSGHTEASVPGTRVECEIRLYQTAKRVDLLYSLVKDDNSSPEALYVAFPFAGIEPGQIRYEIQGGPVSPGENQLEGTSSDWQAFQNYCLVEGPVGGIILTSAEIPLVQLGGLNLGEFRYISEVREPHVYSWVMNNYWVTNFRASQPGTFAWSYAMTTTPHKEHTGRMATEFGWGARIPLLTRVFPPSKGGSDSRPMSLLEIEEPGVMLVAARPLLSGEGIILQVRETEGRKTAFSFRSPHLGSQAYRVRETNVLGKAIGPITSRPELNPLETKFFCLLLSP